MPVPSLTLDTNVLVEYWNEQEKHKITERLLQLANAGKLDLAVTARIRADIPWKRLSDRINELPAINITETGSIFTLGVSALDGADFLGDKGFLDFVAKLKITGQLSVKNSPDWRDWDHIHAHYILRRDAFLTWDKRILHFAGELKMRFGIIAMAPEDYLAKSSK